MQCDIEALTSACSHVCCSGAADCHVRLGSRSSTGDFHRRGACTPAEGSGALLRSHTLCGSQLCEAEHLQITALDSAVDRLQRYASRWSTMAWSGF